MSEQPLLTQSNQPPIDLKPRPTSSSKTTGLSLQPRQDNSLTEQLRNHAESQQRWQQIQKQSGYSSGSGLPSEFSRRGGSRLPSNGITPPTNFGTSGVNLPVKPSSFSVPNNVTLKPQPSTPIKPNIPIVEAPTSVGMTPRLTSLGRNAGKVLLPLSVGLTSQSIINDFSSEASQTGNIGLDELKSVLELNLKRTAVNTYLDMNPHFLPLETLFPDLRRRLIGERDLETVIEPAPILKLKEEVPQNFTGGQSQGIQYRVEGTQVWTQTGSGTTYNFTWSGDNISGQYGQQYVGPIVSCVPGWDNGSLANSGKATWKVTLRNAFTGQNELLYVESNQANNLTYTPGRVWNLTSQSVNFVRRDGLTDIGGNPAPITPAQYAPTAAVNTTELNLDTQLLASGSSLAVNPLLDFAEPEEETNPKTLNLPPAPETELTPTIDTDKFNLPSPIIKNRTWVKTDPDTGKVTFVEEALEGATEIALSPGQSTLISPGSQNPADSKPKEITAPTTSPNYTYAPATPEKLSSPNPGTYPGTTPITPNPELKDGGQFKTFSPGSFQVPNPLNPEKPIPVPAPLPIIPAPPVTVNPKTGTLNPQPPEPTPELPPTPNNACKTGCVGQVLDGVEQNNKKLDDLKQNIINNLGDILQSPLLNEINERTKTINTKMGDQVEGGLSGFLINKFQKLWQSRVIDRAINLMTLAAAVHNATMLSRNVGETLLSAVSNVMSFIGIKDADEQVHSFAEAIGDGIENAIKGIIGAENYTNLTETWQKANRIYQAASNIISLFNSSLFGIAEGAELIGKYTGKIGNALKRSGTVLENSYDWMSEKFEIKTGKIGQFQKVLDGIEQAENVASDLESATSEIREVGDNLQEITAEKEQINGALKDKEDEKKEEQDAAKQESQSPNISASDLVKPSP
jgi:hypothetical protein